MSNAAKDAEILVLGTGNFGTCLANHLAQQDHPVLLWGRSQQIVDSINQTHRNPKYLSHIELDKRIKAISEISADLMKKIRFLVLAIPTQFLRSVLKPLRSILQKDTIIVCSVKGIENETLAFPYNIIEQELGKEFRDRTVILSGPSFAIEVAERQPTAVSVACKDPEINKLTQEIFHSSLFRVYTTDDPMGLEVAGALKNVIAIATGAAAGLGFQQNARAALLARGLAEAARIGATLGANPLTFMGLGGAGDIFLTCTSEKSRNFTVGYRIGKGEKLEDVLNTLGSVAEGVATTRAAYALTSKLKVDAPIVSAVYSVLYGGQTVASALHGLLNREMKSEITSR